MPGVRQSTIIMDKFVVKTPSASSKPKTRSHLPVDDGRLFCSSCNMVVDYLRKFVVDKHLEAASHKRNAERKDSGKQQSLKTVMSCKTVAQVEKVRICC